jgi:hypothetical protein
MSVNMTKRMRYLRDRCVNAYWMLRTGKFKLILKSIYIEISYRIERIIRFLQRIDIQVSIRLKGEEPILGGNLHLTEHEVPGSAFVDKRKVLPPSYRPTVSYISTRVPLLADSVVVASELKQILSGLSVQEIDKL